MITVFAPLVPGVPVVVTPVVYAVTESSSDQKDRVLLLLDELDWSNVYVLPYFNYIFTYIDIEKKVLFINKNSEKNVRKVRYKLHKIKYDLIFELETVLDYTKFKELLNNICDN